MPELDDYIDRPQLDALIDRARREDLGELSVDVTSSLLLSADQQGEAELVSRARGRLSGLALLQPIVQAYDRKVTVEELATDGDAAEPGDVLARFRGPLASILTMERLVLNFCIHLSGVATLTWRFVEAVQGTRARIFDTRKTLPGLRSAQKYAVRVQVNPDRLATLGIGPSVVGFIVATISAALAIKWLISFARGRGEKSMAERLANELLSASRNEGSTIKKKEDTHRMAEANKAFAHYRW